MGPIKRTGLSLIALSCAIAVALVFAATALADAVSVTITAPAAGATVSATVTITAVCIARGSHEVSFVEYCIDNSGSWVAMSGPNGSQSGIWTASWNSTTVLDGSHTIVSRETESKDDKKDKTELSLVRTVNVLNGTITISVPSTSTLAVSMNATATTPVVIKVKSTVPWGLTVQADQALQVATRTIPAARLAFTSSTDGTSGVVVSVAKPFLIGSSTSVITSCGVTPVAGNDITALYRLRVTYDDSPGVYSALHTYTVTGN